ncbi:hypothetical protein F9C07_5601 [Aspergillus flavus]|uniref:Uncharacterized protein n=1 Tax=Aspergillus flavus (strain ATCC 200026 / FGSC A1120 / IAM 13836 / NRRL 3357 / JCM 12722 / SRRC 167) TaxID=332952 RepID=A0A7U2MX92_ASPFN|nr:hypothetical protein F9C07_5601 [Aspergillus flavus]
MPESLKEELPSFSRHHLSSSGSRLSARPDWVPDGLFRVAMRHHMSFVTGAFSPHSLP